MDYSETANRGKSGIALLFLAATSLLLASIGLTYWAGVQALKSTRTLANQQSVIQHVDRLFSTLKDAETGQRGYLLTGEESYLGPYKNAVPAIRTELAELHNLVSSGDLEGEPVEQIDALTRQKLAELDRTIGVRRNRGLEAALAIVRTNQGKRTMDAIRAKVAEIDGEKEAAVEQAARETNRAIHHRTAVFALTALLNLAFLVWVYRRITHEIGRREAAVRETEREKQLLATTLSSIGDGVIATDTDARITFMNRVAATLTGWSLEESQQIPVGNVFKIVNEETRAAVESPVVKVLTAGAVAGLANHTVLIRKDGSEVPIDDSGAPISGADGRTHGVVLVFRDVTERKRTEEELRRSRDELELRVQERTAALTRANLDLERAKQAAESANRAKSTFLANMSHEIRTPLNGVIGMTELVLKSPLSVQQREYLLTVKDSGEALLSVINDILDFSKIEAGKLALDNATFDIRESLGDTMKSFALRAHQRGLELTCFIHPEVPHFVVGDYNRLRQVVVNLVGNALKFTQTGEVSLEVSQESRTEQDVALHFVVSDTGIGVPEVKRSTIFEMFEQADNSTTRRHGGTGLGLAIAARLVALMDGRIWLESEVGQGSRFHFTIRLPLYHPTGIGGQEEPAELDAPEPESLHEMRVFVVDDNATNRRILEETLRSWRMIPASAASAEEALVLLRRASEAGEPYRLVVTDAHMPRTDGFTLAERIKQDPAIGSAVIMMLTSGDRPEDIARCNELGIAAYMLKPVKQSELLESIELALGITMPREELLRAAAQQPRRVRSLHILLAEDSLVNQQLAVALLEGQGHTVTLVSNGKEAIAATGAQKFDLVLMDVQMPELDGLEATEQIRAREQQTGTRLPIIAMTAHALKGDRERCLGAGMDNYVAKPIRAEELFQAIETIFSDYQQYSPAAGPREVVNWGEALKTAQGNQNLLKSLMEAALVEFPQRMAAIRNAVAGGNQADLRLAAHTLRGSLRYFGANQASEYAAKLEDMGRKGEIEESEAVLDNLEAEIAEVTSMLADYLRES